MTLSSVYLEHILNLYYSTFLVFLFLFGHINEKVLAAPCSQIFELYPELVNLFSFHHEHETHWAAYFIFSDPLQLPHTLFILFSHFLFTFWCSFGLVRIQVAKIPLLMFEKKMSIARSASQYSKEKSISHNINQSLQILRFRFIKSNPSHYEYNQVLPIPWQFIQKHTSSIVAYCHSVSSVKGLKSMLNQIAGFAGVIPLTLLFMRKKLFWRFCQRLNGKRKSTVIVE